MWNFFETQGDLFKIWCNVFQNEENFPQLGEILSKTTFPKLEDFFPKMLGVFFSGEKVAFE